MKKILTFCVLFVIYFIWISFFSTKNIFEYMRIKKEYTFKKNTIAELDKKIEKLKLELSLINNRDEDYIEALIKEKSQLMHQNEQLIILK